MLTDKLNYKTEKLVEEYGDSGYALLNKETGEYNTLPFGSALDLLPQKYIVNHKQKFKAKEVFAKVYKNPIEILGKKLSNRDFAWFMRLIPYINKEDNVLVHNGKYLSTKDISVLLEANYDNVRTVFRNYEKLGLIRKIERPSQKDVYKTVKVLSVNPFIMFNGQNLDVDIYELFKDTEWAGMIKE